MRGLFELKDVAIAVPRVWRAARFHRGMGDVPAIFKPSRLSVSYQTHPVSDGALTTVSVFALFDFSDPYYLLTEQALWPMVTEQTPNGAIFDKGRLKPRAEVIISGCALSPTDEPIEGTRVVARFGSWEKRLAVFGDRYWRLGEHGVEMTSAEPFLKMPIGDVQAYGGPDFVGNPRGKGYGGRKLVNAGFDAPLPNVESLDALIRSIDDMPKPAHFGPLAADDPGRMRYIGTYDQHWIKHVSPLPPADFNPLYHCEAPEDQRFGEYFEGGDVFSISGMSRGTPTVGGQTPKFRARCFYHMPASDAFIETSLRCDTVTLFPNVEKATLTFRGLIKGVDRFADDIGAIMVALERADDAPREASYYLDIFQKRRSPETAHKHALSDFELMPERDPQVVGARRRERLAKAQADRELFIANQNWAARKYAQEQGVPEDMVPPIEGAMLATLPLVAAPTQEEMENGEMDLAELLDDVKELETALMAKMDEEMAKAELQRRALVASSPAGLLPSAALRPIVSEEKLAEISIDDLPEDFLQGVENMDQQFADLETSLREGISHEEVERADELEQAIGAALASLGGGADDDEAALEKQFAQACARALRLPEGSLLHEARASMDDLDLSMLEGGLTAPEPDLDDAFLDLIGGPLEAPEPDGAPLSLSAENMIPHNPYDDAPSTRARMGEALFEAGEKFKQMFPNLELEDEANPFGSLMDRVQSVAGPLDEETLSKPANERAGDMVSEAKNRLSAADEELEASLIVGRQMSPAPLFPMEAFKAGVAERFGGFLREKIAAGHDFKGADLAGAILDGVNFSGRDLSGTFFEQANLAGANFSGCNLVGAVFTGALLDGANFDGADLTRANISKASLVGARFNKSIMDDLTIIQSDLTGVLGDGARLTMVRFIECKLDGMAITNGLIADLQCLVGSANETSFSGSRVERAMFVTTPMDRVQFVNADLERVGFMEVKAAGANFSAAKLHSVGFMGACELMGSRFDGIRASESSWNTANLQESCFLRAQCHSCFFNTCDMEATDFRLGSFRNSLFGGSKMADSDFFGANLFNASMTSADLRRCSMRGANLYAASLVEAKLASCDLSGANLGATLMDQPTHA